VTVYDVAGTGGWGRHQGLAIFGAERIFDERFSLASSPDLAYLSWRLPPTLGDLPIDVSDTLLHGNPFSDLPMCAPPTVLLDRPLSNHGRAMSREDVHAAQRVEIAHYHGDDLTNVADCMEHITDGYCDSVCGNCSYVLPSLIVAGSRSGDWSQEASRLWGEPGCPSDEAYYGHPGDYSVPSVLGYRFPNPFTHCAWQRCADEAYEAPTLDAYAWFGETVISGLYGHNSNADAEAEYRAFQHCVDPAAWPETEACGACGTDDDKRQYPCRDQTNTAAHFWPRTADGDGLLFDDLYSVISDDLVQASAGPPICNWAPFEVQGM